ncbi:MAG TPA: Pycsar system effector family protein [Flavobacteriales bacterium]
MNLLERTEAFVRDHVAAHFPSGLCFHNAFHFEQVVRQVGQLADAKGVSAEDGLALRIAAWGHDIGYAEGSQDHEQRSAATIATFLADQGAEAGLIEHVRRLILATRTDTKPGDELEAMIKDADLGHIAAPDYPERLALLRREQELAGSPKKRKRDWFAENIAFLERTDFHSTTARDLWSAGRSRNLDALKAMMHGTDPASPTPAAEADDRKAHKAAKKAEKERRNKVKETERGVETLFRVTLNNHTRLSQIADNKANIMLTVNALMISLLISGPMTRVDKHPEYIPALTIVLVTCALSIITATLATRPKITSGRSTAQQMKDRTANLLFFGNFHDMPLDEYQKGMNEVMQDRDYLYGSMTRDLHALGSVLHRKYKYLRITYTIFMFGVTSTVLLIVGSMLAEVMPWAF